jgi:hypothetical protein
MGWQGGMALSVISTVAVTDLSEGLNLERASLQDCVSPLGCKANIYFTITNEGLLLKTV